MSSPTKDRAAGSQSPGACAYCPDELVVALPHSRLVTALLGQWGCRPEVAAGDENHRLGLARMTLDAAVGVRRLAADPALAPRLENVRRRAAFDDRTASDRTASDLDLISGYLRSYCAERYGGWVPIFGKNRQVTRSLYVIDMQEEHGYQALPEWAFSGEGTPRTIGGRPERTVGDVPVDVVDTAVWGHPWLAGGVTAGGSALLRNPRPGDPDHATFVAGLILRQAPAATVRVRDVFGGAGTGESWDLACAIAEVASKDPRVLNLSLGCVTDDSEPPLTLTAAMDALPTDTVVIAAAGNEDPAAVARGECPRPDWPAALPRVVAVGALDAAGERAAFSAEAPWVDVMSYGVDVLSTAVAPLHDQAEFARWSGTSFAAAAVSGALAARLDDDTNPRSAWEKLTRGCELDAGGRPVVPLEDFPAVTP